MAYPMTMRILKNVLSFKSLYDRYIHNCRDLLANLLVSINIAYWTSTVRLYMYDNITTAFLRRTNTCRKLYIFTKANRPLDWKKKPHTKNSALPSTPPPHIFSSGTTFSCCVLVCKNTCTVYFMPKAPLWAYVCMCVCVFKYLLWNHWANWSQISCGTTMG